MSMEPVAWRLRWIYPATGQATSWASTTDKFVADQKGRDGLEVEPLVPASRLSDAEEKIAELEAMLKDERERGDRIANDWFTFCEDMEVKPDTQEAVAYELKADFSNLRDRADAAEALMKEKEAKIERLMLFGGRMANACYNVGQKARPSHMDMVDLLFAQGEWDNAVRAARSLAAKIGGKDE